MFRYLNEPGRQKPSRRSQFNHGNPRGFQRQDASETHDPDWYGEHQDHDDQDATDSDGGGEEWV
jgi:hypothetical protein